MMRYYLFIILELLLVAPFGLQRANAFSATARLDVTAFVYVDRFATCLSN